MGLMCFQLPILYVMSRIDFSSTPMTLTRQLGVQLRLPRGLSETIRIVGALSKFSLLSVDTHLRYTLPAFQL